jgi:MYXO-CTERM domain-containing protein
MRAVCLAFVVAGCTATPLADRLAADTVIDAHKRSPQPRPAVNARVLWIDFDGGTITNGAVDNATTDVSQLASASTVFPAYDPSVSAPRVAAADAILAVYGRASWLLRSYGVSVVSTRPSSGAYSRVVVSGTPALLGRSSALAGLAPLDCTDANGDNIAFAFADEATPSNGGVVVLANVIAHEAAHTFGLEHVDNTDDVMFAMAPAIKTPSLPQLFTLAFTSSANYSSYFAGSGPVAEQCGRADPIDDDALMLAALGASTPGIDTQPPTVNWVTPQASIDRVPDASLAIEWVAADNFAVDHVEVYRNTELWTVLHAPPWQATVDPDPALDYMYVTVEAVDTSGLRTANTRRFDVGLPEAGVVLGDDSGVPDASLAADAGFERPVSPPGCGCAVGGRSSAGSWWWLVIALSALLRWVRRRRFPSVD